MAGLLRRRVNGVNDDTVEDATGNNWAEWCRALDRAGARMMDHAELASYLRKKHGLSTWWSQKVAVGYEHERGMRKKLQRGYRYAVDRTKTMAVPLAVVWSAWTNDSVRAGWLPGMQFEVKTSTRHKVMHLRCADGTKISVWFREKDGKTNVAVTHDRLATQADAERMQAYWSEALERLRGLLEA